MVGRRQLSGSRLGQEADFCTAHQKRHHQVRQDHQDALLSCQPTVPLGSQLEAAALQDGVQTGDDLRLPSVARLRSFPPEETPSQAEPAAEDDAKPGSLPPDRRRPQDGED